MFYERKEDCVRESVKPVSKNVISISRNLNCAGMRSSLTSSETAFLVSKLGKNLIRILFDILAYFKLIFLECGNSDRCSNSVHEA